MQRIRAFLRNPAGQGLLIIAVVLILYIYASRPIEFINEFAIYGNQIYLATGEDGVRILELGEGNQPSQIGYFNTPGTAQTLQKHENYLFIADGGSGLRLLDISNPATPVEIKHFDTPGFAYDFILEGKTIYLSDGNGGLRVLAYKVLNDPEDPITQIGEVRVRANLTRMAIRGDTIFVGDRNGRLWSFDVTKPSEPGNAKSINLNSAIYDIVLRDNFAYLAGSQRGIIVVDISDPNAMKEVSVTSTEGDARSIWLEDDYAFVANSANNVKIFDISSPTTIGEVDEIETPGQAAFVSLRDRLAFISDGFNGLLVNHYTIKVTPVSTGRSNAQSSVEDVFVQGNTVYLAAGDRGIRVLDAANKNQLREIGFFDTSGYSSGIYVQGDIAYLADKTEGLIILDVSNPANGISVINQIDLGDDTRDVHFSNNTLFLAEGAAGLRIFNLADPRSPAQLGHFDSPGAANSLAYAEDHVYLADGGSGLRVINISDPEKPTEVGALDSPGDSQAVAILIRTTTSTDGKESRSVYALLADGSRGLRIIDVTNTREPREVATYEKLEFVQDVIVSGERAYLAGRGQGVAVLNLADPTKPVEQRIVPVTGQAYGLAVQENYLYVAAFERGMRLLDVSNLQNPAEISFFDAPARLYDVYAFGNNVFAVDGEKGMWVLDASDASKVREAGFLAIPGLPQQLWLNQTTAYVAAGASGVVVVDVSDPARPRLLKTIDTDGEVLSVTPFGNYLYVADGRAGLKIMDISNLEAIHQVGKLNFNGSANAVVGSGKYVYVAGGADGVRIISVANPAEPALDSVFSEANQAQELMIKGEYLYVADGSNGLRILNVNLPLDPRQVSLLNLGTNIQDVTLVGNIYAVLSDSGGGIWVVDISDPRNPFTVGEHLSGGNALAVYAITRAPEAGKPASYRIYAAFADRGLAIYDTTKSVESEQVALYETPGTATQGQILASLPALVTFNFSQMPDKVRSTLAQVSFDFCIAGLVGILFWLAVVGQFVLPVRGLRQRMDLFSRLIYFLLRAHGPAIAVRNGQALQTQEERERRGPGVMRVDLASGVLLERRYFGYPLLVRLILGLFQRMWRFLLRLLRITPAQRQPDLRVVGPGIQFTEMRDFPSLPRWYEVVRGVIDLRPQIRFRRNATARFVNGEELPANVNVIFSVGMRPDTLLVTYADNDRTVADKLRTLVIEERYEVDQNGGRRQSLAVARTADDLDPDDKLEIHEYITRQRNLAAWQPFRLNPQRTEPELPFYFDAQRVFAALSATAQVVNGEAIAQWTDLPPVVAGQIFRNLFADENFDNLNNRIRDLRGQFGAQVRNTGVLAVRFVERLKELPLVVTDPNTGRTQPAPGNQLGFREDELRALTPLTLTTPKILRNHGIRVINANFSWQPLQGVLREQRRQSWAAEWQAQAVERLASYEVPAMAARTARQVETAPAYIGPLREIITDPELPDEVLALRIYQALELASTDPQLREVLPGDTVQLLRSLRHWLLDDQAQRLNPPAPGAGGAQLPGGGAAGGAAGALGNPPPAGNPPAPTQPPTPATGTPSGGAGSPPQTGGAPSVTSTPPAQPPAAAPSVTNPATQPPPAEYPPAEDPGATPPGGDPQGGGI